MGLAVDTGRAPEDLNALEQSLLRDTAAALAEAHDLLERSRSRTTHVTALKSQAAIDQDKLVTAQSNRIRSLERQLSDLQAFGASQAAALDEAIALVTELEQRMGVLERANAELQMHIERPRPATSFRSRRSDERSFEGDLDLIRIADAGRDLTRFSDFARQSSAA